MCTISIDPSSITVKPIGTTGTTNVSMSGTVANCASNDIKVTIICAASTSSATAQLNGNIWMAEVGSKCPCGTPVTITATCQDPVPCTATINTVMNCNCCPQAVSAVVNQGLWNSSGQQLVTFMTTLTFPAGCFVAVQRNFGDGYFGVQQTFTSSPASYQETHAYYPGGYTSNLNVLSNASCGAAAEQVTVSASAPPCATKPFLASLCRGFQVLFLLFGAIAGVLFIASASPICNPPPNFPLLAIATGWAIAAAVFLVLLYLLCRKCVCGFFVKLIGQLFVIVGAVLLMFVLPVNCTQPFPFPAPFVALGAAVVALLFGAAALLWGGWYQPLKAVCPLTICDYWQAIKDALILAVFAALIVYFSLIIGVTVTHLGFALLAISVLLILTNQQIQINQNAAKC